MAYIGLDSSTKMYILMKVQMNEHDHSVSSIEIVWTGESENDGVEMCECLRRDEDCDQNSHRGMTVTFEHRIVRCYKGESERAAKYVCLIESEGRSGYQHPKDEPRYRSGM